MSASVAKPWDSFDACGFLPAVRDALTALGFDKPTEVQARCWPIIVAGSDVVGVSATGSGKTLAFLTPTINLLLQKPFALMRGKALAYPRLLVLAPTRELAKQIHDEGRKLVDGLRVRLRSVALYGGVDMESQKSSMRERIHWCTGTPGRVLDFLTRGQLSLDDLSALVLDEADQMLCQGFEPQLREIMSRRPSKLQTLLFTATWEPSGPVRWLAAEYLFRPEHIQIGAADRASNQEINQFFHRCSNSREKMARLTEELEKSQLAKRRVIVFTNTKASCAELQDRLLERGQRCVTLNGDMDQAAREAALGAFRASKPGVLVATDVAARGLDIDDIAVVVNYDLPTALDVFVHRVGRTGRAGKTGVAVTLLSPDKQDLPVAQDILGHLTTAGIDVPALAAFVDAGLEIASCGTHNTGFTNPKVKLEGHNLARVLASDKLIVEETLRRGLRFMNIERSKALDDRFRRPKWRFRRLIPMSELEAAAQRQDRGRQELAGLTDKAGVVHAMITDLYDPQKYIATEMFELPRTSEHMWQIFDQLTEMLLESDDADFAELAVTNEAVQEALKAHWERGDKEDEFYYQTFSKLPFVHFKNKPFLHYLCEEGTFVNTLKPLLRKYSHETAEHPWLRLVDVASREKQYGNTAFHICAYAGYYELLEVLLGHARQHSVPVQHLKTIKGETALDVAKARENLACFNLLAPFFGADFVPGGVDATKIPSVLVVDGSEAEGSPRESVALPRELSLATLAHELQQVCDKLPGVPDLILIKKVHLSADGPSDAEAFLQLASTARSLTAYGCTVDSLQVLTHVLSACRQMYEMGNPAWQRLFFLPDLRGDPTPAEKESFTEATEALVRCLQEKSNAAQLRLHSFGRDGSKGYSFPRSYLTRSCLADVVHGVFHVNIFLHLRAKLESKVELQEADITRLRKRSREGRHQLSKEDLGQKYFFAAKWGALDRFFYCRELVQLELAEAAPAEGLRAGVEAEAFLQVVSEYLDMWTYPLTASMPQGLPEIMDDYMAALDEGLWCLLQHHRLLPTLPALVQKLLERCPVGSELPRAVKWMQDHDKTRIVSVNDQ